MQADPFEREEREEEPALPRGDPPTQPSALRDRARSERDRIELDVRILVHLIRGGVVPGVLVPPPADAHAGDRARQDACRPVVAGRRVEHLPVRAVVAEERDLDEDERQRGGQEQLVPGVAERTIPAATASKAVMTRLNRVT